MTPEQVKALLPILQAYAEGKTIQVKYGESWMDSAELSFDNDVALYRIKPEPKEYWLGLHPDMDYIKEKTGNKKAIAVCVFPYEGPESYPTQGYVYCNAKQFIHVREVVD